MSARALGARLRRRIRARGHRDDERGFVLVVTAILLTTLLLFAGLAVDFGSFYVRAAEIKRAADGHYWLRAEINGHPANFLVDTGATLTAVSTETAEAAGLEARDGGLPIRMQTANGAVAAELTTIEELRFGNVAARGLDAIIAPGLGSTNVIGMNLLSRLASVRLEGETMILVPNNPQAALEVR